MFSNGSTAMERGTATRAGAGVEVGRAGRHRSDSRMPATSSTAMPTVAPIRARRLPSAGGEAEGDVVTSASIARNVSRTLAADSGLLLIPRGAMQPALRAGSGSIDASDGAGRVSIAAIILVVSIPANGVRPDSSSYATTPSA